LERRTIGAAALEVGAIGLGCMPMSWAYSSSQQRSDRGIADYQRDFGRQTPKFSAGYGKRGLTGGGVSSGVYSNAMRNYVGDYQQNLNRQYADKATDANQYDLNTANYEAERQQALADIETNKARDIANAANYLNALKGQFS